MRRSLRHWRSMPRAQRLAFVHCVAGAGRPLAAAWRVAEVPVLFSICTHVCIVSKSKRLQPFSPSWKHACVAGSLPLSNMTSSATAPASSLLGFALAAGRRAGDPAIEGISLDCCHASAFRSKVTPRGLTRAFPSANDLTDHEPPSAVSRLLHECFVQEKENASCSVGATSLAMLCFRANRGLVFLRARHGSKLTGFESLVGLLRRAQQAFSGTQIQPLRLKTGVSEAWGPTWQILAGLSLECWNLGFQDRRGNNSVPAFLEKGTLRANSQL